MVSVAINNVYFLSLCILSLLTSCTRTVAVCTLVCDDPSANTTVIPTVTNASVMWSSTFGGTGQSYIVQHREINSGFNFEPSSLVTNNSYTIEGLEHSEDYEVQVCLFSDTSNCGNCLICFTTLVDIPGVPLNLMVSSSGPRSFTASWENPTNTKTSTNYIISYGTDSNNLTESLFVNNLLRATISNNILPNTEYFITVLAMNVAGNGPSTDVASVTTASFSASPAALLVALGDRLVYYSIADETNLGNDFASLIPQNPLLNTTTINIIDIDYDYRRSNVYVTTNNGTIIRYNVTITQSNNDIMLSHTDTAMIYSDLGTVGSITVDWVNDRIYWIKFESNMSQIYSGPLSGEGPIKVHGQPLAGTIDSLSVDPIHGYFYWVLVGVNLIRMNYSLVIEATTDTDFTSLYTELASGTELTSFTLDLADSQFFYLRTDSGFVLRKDLSNNTLNDPTNTAAEVLTLKTSFSTMVVTISGNILVIRDQNFTSGPQPDLGDPIHDARFFRSSYQPLPVPPSPVTNVQVFGQNSTNIIISWKIPAYSSNTFGLDAFNEWVYSIDYQPIGSSDTQSFVTTLSNISLPNLESATTYIFNITVRGITEEGSITTPDTYAFTTFRFDTTPTLLVTTDEGVLVVDTQGTDSRFLSNQRIDLSSGAAYNAHFDPIRYYVSTESGDFFVEDSSQTQIDLTRTNGPPMFLQVDWITRRLYWVEEQLSTIVSVPTVNFTQSNELSDNIQTVETVSNGVINGMALDSANGVLFWITDTVISRKPLNTLEPAQTCYDFTVLNSFDRLRAITIDSNNNRLFIVYFDDSSQPYVATLDYTTFTCDEASFMSRAIDGIVLSAGNAISMAYAANTLYVSQYSQLKIHSFTAEFASVDSDDLLALGCIEIIPDIVTPTQLRSLSVVLIENQPLPDILPFEYTGDVTILTPTTPGIPVLNDITSNTTFIDITWEDPLNFDISDVFYKVEINLTRATGETRPSINENIFEGNSIQLTNQSFSTRVEIRVTPYSLWFVGPAVSAMFISPADLPDKVQNVRAHVFFPVRNDTSVVSAQIVWDGLTIEEAGGILTKYSINITNVPDGTLITAQQELWNATFENGYSGPPFFVDGTQTQFTVAISGFERHVYYPLFSGREYTVTVNGINSAGAGEISDAVMFNTNSSTPPREVLIASLNGGEVVNEGNNENNLQGVTPPIAIQNINRTIYYYNSNSHSLNRGSLDRNTVSEELTILPSNLIPTEFTFDWISQTIYIIGRNNETGTLQIWTVFDLNPIPTLFMTLSDVVPESVKIIAVINPYLGFLQWTQSATSTMVYQLNLRTAEVTSLLSSTKKRSVDINSLTVTAALAWDPFTQEVWLCDSVTGNIINCNTSSSELTNCAVVVSASNLGVTPTGLPADQLAIDENTIYWSQSSESIVYYTNRSDPTSLGMFTTSNNDFVLLSVSPGQQPLPDSYIDPFFNFVAVGDIFCLSPDFTQVANRPDPDQISITNTTVSLQWEEPTLPMGCEDLVFSFIPLAYRVEFRTGQDMIVPGYPMTFYDTVATLTNLTPYTLYTVRIEARNRYSILASQTDPSLYGVQMQYRTEEGVPSPLQVNYIVYGPSAVYLYWQSLDEGSLQGNVSQQSYTLSLNDTTPFDITDTSYNFTRNLIADSVYTFQLSVSNGVLRSPLTTLEVTTFQLPPTPVVISVTNVSFIVNVTITNEHASYLRSITIIVEDTEKDSRLINNSSEADFQFRVNNLRPFTNYSVSILGEYTVPNGLTVNDTSVILQLQTDTSHPDSPVIRLQELHILEWEIPNDNGEEITGYTLFYTLNFSNSAITNFKIDNGSQTTLELSAIILTEGDYTLTLEAINRRGSSALSAPLLYTAETQTEFYQEIPFIIGMAAGGGFLMVVIFFMLLGICCCCCCTPPDKRAVFRPDYELIRLREEYAKSRQHAFNPNYMWTRDDYKGYQDDLENINKFPRNKLRLENFIDRGEFGEVYQGTAIDILAVDSGPTPVAVKTMRKGASHEEKEKFLSEAALMSNFNHQNIVKVLGVCLDHDPLLIMELMPAGDLLKFLREARQESGPPLLTLAEQVQVAIDVAQGCRYLEQQHFIHRDIAARNCLVSSKGADRVVKIGDFGLAKDLYTSDYYQVEGQRKLPVRWMAPEALLQGKFTMETDIWSYGVLLWEIFTFGNQPYPGRNNQEVLQFVSGGGRLEKPENCSIRVYKLMQVCWETSPSERLHFAQITEYMAHYLEHVNNKRDSYYSEDEEEPPEGGEEDLTRKPSRPSRTSSVRSVGLIHLARQGSVRIRRSIRGRTSLKKEDFESSLQNNQALNSEENLVDDDRAFRERGPF